MQKLLVCDFALSIADFRQMAVRTGDFAQFSA